VHNRSVDQRKSYISDCLILEWPLWFGSSSLQFGTRSTDHLRDWLWDRSRSSVILTHRPSRGLSFKKNVRTCSTDSLTASSANKMSACTVKSVNKIRQQCEQNPFDTFSVQTNAHRGIWRITDALEDLMRVLLIRIEPEDCEYWTGGLRGRDVLS